MKTRKTIEIELTGKRERLELYLKRISIHAPREGGDKEITAEILAIGISIHAPREGGDSKDAQFYL